MWWTLLIPLAAPLSPAALAPGPRELAAADAEMDARLDRMEAIADAVGRLQGAWGERLATGDKPDPCANPDAASLVARSRVIGTAYRDAVQSARAELDRLEQLWSAPTVIPLLDSEDRARADTIRATVAMHTEMVLEAASWHGRYVEPHARSCPVELHPTPGLGYVGARAVQTQPYGVAVIGIGGGLVCPAADPANGGVTITAGKACYGVSDCTCAPADVLPGAVLGP